MNVLHVTFDMGIGGTEQVICQLIAGLDAEQYGNQVVCIDRTIGNMGLALQEGGMPIHVMGRNSGLDWQVVKRLHNLVKTQKIDIVHCHQYTPYCYGVLAAVFTNARVIFTEHGRFYPDSFTWKRRAVNRVLLFGTSEITAISRATRKALDTFEWIPERRTSVIYNGIADPGINSGHSETLRLELGLNDEAIVVGTVSRLDPIKNQLMMIDGFAMVAKKNRHIRLLIVGDGPSRNELESRVNELGIQQFVIFTGFIDKPYAYIDLLDIFLLTSRSEGTSMTLLEAMAKQKPCIATNVGGNPEVIVDGETGILVESEDTSEFARVLHSLVEDAHARKLMGDAARNRYLSTFTISNMVDQYERLYRSSARR